MHHDALRRFTFDALSELIYRANYNELHFGYNLITKNSLNIILNRGQTDTMNDCFKLIEMTKKINQENNHGVFIGHTAGRHWLSMRFPIHFFRKMRTLSNDRKRKLLPK